MSNLNDFVIENGVLIRCAGAGEVVIPDGITVIGKRAFYGNNDIVSVTMPESVDTIEQEAFCYCQNLNNINISGEIKKVGKLAFGWLYDHPELELSIYNKIPIRVFSKATQNSAASDFTKRFNELDSNSAVFEDNIRFIGTNLKQASSSGVYSFLGCFIRNENLRRAVLDGGTIPLKDIDKLQEIMQKENYTEFVAELMEYKNKLMKNPDAKKTFEKYKEREEKKVLTPEMSVTDWRKIFKFSYSDGAIIIKEVKECGKELLIPAVIGEKRVLNIGPDAICFAAKPAPEKIIISEGIKEISKRAFLCVENAEVFIPSTVTTLAEGTFVAVWNIVLHLTDSVTNISKELAWDSLEPAIKEIHAPAGSFAEEYAKENGIPFVAE